MSSELPLDRLGLSNSFETRTSQASDSPNEQRNEDVKGPDSSEKPQSGVDHGSDEKEGKVKAIGPEAFEKGGRVFVANVGKAEFSYVIPKGDEISLTLVLYHENGTAQDLGPSGLNANPDSAQDSSRDKYIAELPLQPIAERYSDGRFFVVLDESDAFGSFALGLFSVTDDVNKVSDLKDDLENDIEQNEDLNGGITDDDSPWAFEGITGATGDNDNGGPDGTLSGDGNKDAETDDDSGGLTTAEKAGIGAGVGVGSLILIGLAIFFFLRRRKRAATTNKSLTPGNDYIRDKEVHSAQVAETPHSPASDDDNRPRDSAFAAAAPAADRSSAVATPSSERRAVPHSVAHLVEEGMTEEQIRRLEEEERDLDQAIERAGRR